MTSQRSPNTPQSDRNTPSAENTYDVEHLRRVENEIQSLVGRSEYCFIQEEINTVTSDTLPSRYSIATGYNFTCSDIYEFVSDDFSGSIWSIEASDENLFDDLEWSESTIDLRPLDTTNESESTVVTSEATWTERDSATTSDSSYVERSTTDSDVLTEAVELLEELM